MTIREQYQHTEEMILAPCASKSRDSGRQREEDLCEIRTPYQRDRDRIIHCKSFRRLKHKTQVFIAPTGDHFRTRLTHTLEVSQIARTIARALRLNEDLTEAIALGHDLGHTPFGHSGERILNSLYEEGFEHNVHSIRVAERLENDKKGLNLTFQVQDGILNHRGGGRAQTLEGDVVRFSDKIAYLNHDIDDAIRGNVLKPEQIPKEILDTLGDSHKERINTLVFDIIKSSQERKIAMSDDMQEKMRQLREFMFQTVYLNDRAREQEEKACHVISSLYGMFLKRPEKMPPEFLNTAKTEGTARGVCDYIAGMTDQYCIDLFCSLFIPQSWQIK